MVEWYWQGKTKVLGEKHYTAWEVDGWMSMEQWWNDTDKGKMNYWEKNIIQCGGKWMNEYGAMVEWYWQGKTEVLGEKNYKAWVVDRWISTEQWWNDNDRGKLEYWEKNIIQCGGKWMIEYEAMVEWYWQGKTGVLGEKYYTAWVVDAWISMEQWWDGTDRGKLKYWGKKITQRGW